MLNYEEASLNGSSITITEEEYTLFFLTDAGIGPSDENGLTGCDSFIIPYFYNNYTKTVHFIQSAGMQSNNYFVLTYLGWLSLSSSEGGESSISSIDVSENTLALTLNVSYQDGGDTVQLDIYYSDGLFSFSSMASIKPSED